MPPHARLLAAVALALGTRHAAQARNGHSQCGLSVLQSHLADVQTECCFDEAKQVGERLGEDLRVYWRFEEGEGDVVRDMSDNGNDGRLNRGPQWVNSDLGGAWPRTRPLAHAGFTQDALRCAQGGRTPCT